MEKSADFAGKKPKFAEKSADFTGEKSKFADNRPISRHFSGKKSNFEGFSGANSKKNRPISREISGGNFAEKQSVKKQPISLGFFFGKFRYNRSILRRYDQRCLTFF